MAGGGGERAGDYSIAPSGCPYLYFSIKSMNFMAEKYSKRGAGKKLLRVPWTGRISVYPRGNQP